MSDLTLNVTILDIDVPKAAAAFLRKCPMPQIPDPDYVGEGEPPLIDEYPNTKTRVEGFLKNDLLRAINAGVDLLAQDLGDKLTSDIFG